MEFTIIKNSESHTGYQIEDVEYHGMIPGLCCGWQYEYIDAAGQYHYSSVAWEEQSPEDYANMWQGYRGSWLYDLLPDDYEFTGRVVFRGYAEEYYDFEERETFVREVDMSEYFANVTEAAVYNHTVQLPYIPIWRGTG